jgi:hypothetical protein
VTLLSRVHERRRELGNLLRETREETDFLSYRGQLILILEGWGERMEERNINSAIISIASSWISRFWGGRNGLCSRCKDRWRIKLRMTRTRMILIRMTMLRIKIILISIENENENDKCEKMKDSMVKL